MRGDAWAVMLVVLQAVMAGAGAPAGAGEPADPEGARAFYARPDRALIVAAGLERARIHWPVVRAAARGTGVPEELLFGVAMCESAFNPYARSRAGAEGMFQFMPATGRRYGLRTRAHRRSVRLSARAAARHLAELHRRFGSWELALAAYNAGQGRVARAVRRARSRRWEAVRVFLPRETRNYVPKVLYLAAEVYPRLGDGRASGRPVRLVRVRRGETWWSLGRRFGVPRSILAMMNRGPLVAGMHLAVPTRPALERLRAEVWRLDGAVRRRLAAVCGGCAVPW